MYQGLQYRILAFGIKPLLVNTLVISTPGFIKKRSKVPEDEIQKAIQIRLNYFETKQLKNRSK